LVRVLVKLNGANPYTKNKIGEPNFKFIYIKRQKNEKFRFEQRLSKGARCSKKLDNIFILIRSVKNQSKQKSGQELT
jgi:hypothetical protein